jgi:preprotein translocase subunit YajC
MIESIAFAMGPGGQGEPSGGASSFFASILPLILIFVIFYFLLIRPQQKKQKELRQMLESLKKGDKVITTGGIHGTIEYLSQSTVTLKVADNVKIKVSRGAIAGIRSPAEED